MYILNPPTEQTVADDTVQEQSRDYLSDDSVQYQERDFEYRKDIRNDIYYPKNTRDAHAFIRSYANKTNDMEDGETRNLIVFTKDHAYFVKASGYLTGEIEEVYTILGNEQLIEEAWREFDNGPNKSTEAIDSWRKDNRSRPGRNNGNTVSSGKTGTARRIAQLDGQVYGGSNSFRAYWEDYGYNSWEEISCRGAVCCAD